MCWYLRTYILEPIGDKCMKFGKCTFLVVLFNAIQVWIALSQFENLAGPTYSLPIISLPSNITAHRDLSYPVPTTLFCQTFQQMCVPSCTFYLLATKHYSRDVFISSPWKTCSTLDPPSFLACSTESIWSLNRSLVSITACPASASADSRSCCTCCQHIWVKAFHFHWERFIVAQWSLNQILLQHLYPTHRPTSAFSETCCQQTNFSFQPYLLPTYKPTSAFCSICYQQSSLRFLLPCYQQTNLSFLFHLLPTKHPKISAALATNKPSSSFFCTCYRQSNLSSALVTDKATSSFCCSCYQQSN